ncbi:ABC transporter ATP-binding protein [Ochrobactrum vermis]|uniref:ABC transporter ATP-binding protein n=1 Tax=Ochrobactrum vermis TaxID=1827297 RepID=A0ABU8PLC8_9HYPH|nr:ABC transporter ATP-binding protein [Ochrobactrum vermis]PQZ24438.1 ABC transporter ATP-binding protein [Ochrobactrum vermis]
MIALEDIHVTFNKGTPLEAQALRGVNLTVETGQFLTVIGSNGAGKSTSLNVMAGTIPVESGRVKVNDLDITKLPVHKRAGVISRVFQDPRLGTCEDLSILENFAVACGRTAPRGLRAAVNEQIRLEAAKRLSILDLGLEKRLDDKVGLLSGGQRQAVSLIMATTGPTQVLLLDEHTAALDPKTADFVMHITRSIVSELNLTAIMVTHSMAQALDTGNRTVMFHQGKIIFDVSGDERAQMQVPDLMALFRKNSHSEITDDALLLAH